MAFSDKAPTDKALKRTDTVVIKYTGPQGDVTMLSPEHGQFLFPNNKGVKVPRALAEVLIKQGQFEEVA